MKTRVPYDDSRGKRTVKRNRLYVRRKQRGHSHALYDKKNTRGIMVTRCKVCKHHFFLNTYITSNINQTNG